MKKSDRVNVTYAVGLGGLMLALVWCIFGERAEERAELWKAGSCAQEFQSGRNSSLEQREVKGYASEMQERIASGMEQQEVKDYGLEPRKMGEHELAPQIALTFDDGPHPVYTAQILDGLKERGVTATFFVLGENIEGNEELLERMSQEGHLIGNHTYNHVKLNSLQHEAAVNEIEKTSELVKKVTGEGTEFVRPPFGLWNKTLEYDVTMLPALWNIDTLDWTTKNVPATVGKVMKQAADQDIILFHDCYASSVEAALRAVDLLLEQGYEFVNVDRIILTP